MPNNTLRQIVFGSNIPIMVLAPMCTYESRRMCTAVFTISIKKKKNAERES